MSNNTHHTSLPDAYVLCTTDNFSPDNLSDTFGNYCVKINNPSLFFKLITNTLIQKYDISDSAIGKVIYKDRYYQHTETAPGAIGFVKPKDKYHSQREVRLMWVPKTTNSIQPFSLVCQDVASLCEKIT